MKKLLFFSSNNYKIKEVKDILQDSKVNILSLNNFSLLKFPNETGHTFNENAAIKSKFGYKYFNFPCFADDSGICINALNNMPGVESKRFIKKNGGIKKTFQKIIMIVKKKKDFKAFFQTSIALTLNNAETFFFDGVVEGRIAEIPIGKYGFHYDPIFIPKTSHQTYAQMEEKEKNKISHRAVALNKLKKFLNNSFN